jgi:tetrahydromethanopterin S-methyltransferase subunit G
MTEKVPGWLERVLLPRLSEMAGDIKAINARIDGLDNKIDAVDAKLSAKIDAVDARLAARIDGAEEKLSTKIDELDKRLDIVQRLAVLEAKMGELLPKR